VSVFQTILRFGEFLSECVPDNPEHRFGEFLSECVPDNPAFWRVFK
jgi:hypothetical protein